MADLIRLTAKVLLAICVLAAAIFLFTLGFGRGLITATGSAVSGWLAYILLMGFAEMIDNTAVQAEYSKRILDEVKGGATAAAPVNHDSKPKNDNTNAVSQTTPQNVTQMVQARAVEGSVAGYQVIACPKCGEQQRAGRNVCWQCGVKFTKPEQE